MKNLRKLFGIVLIFVAVFTWGFIGFLFFIIGNGLLFITQNDFKKSVSEMAMNDDFNKRMKIIIISICGIIFSLVLWKHFPPLIDLKGLE